MRLPQPELVRVWFQCVAKVDGNIRHDEIKDQWQLYADQWQLHAVPGGRSIRPVDLATLLEDLAHTPVLRGARCRDQYQLYDRTISGSATAREVRQARREALRICEHCPCLQACADWVDSLEPWQRPRGVVAGQVHAWLPRHPYGPALLLQLLL